jgi:hypothetical protein
MPLPYVSDHHQHGKAYRFTLDPFTVSRQSEPVEPSIRAAGFADRIGNDIVGVFAHDRHAFVFVNDACWDVVADDIGVSYQRLPFLETFRLTRRGKPVFRKIRAGWKQFREDLGDPTFDRIDELGTYALDAIATLVKDRRRATEWAERMSA